MCIQKKKDHSNKLLDNYRKLLHKNNNYQIIIYNNWLL